MYVCEKSIPVYGGNLMKRSIIWRGILALSVMIALIFIGCAGAQRREAPMTPGSFTATAESFLGPTFNVVVQVGEDSILGITTNATTDHHTYSMGYWALPIMKDRILQHQSVEVDVVSGNTITTLLFRNAVRTALQQAGAPRRMLEPVAGTPRTVDVDVLVVGSGLAGSAAAFTAIQTLREQGNANPVVVLIEQQDLPGGTSRFTGNMVTFPLTLADADAWADFIMMRGEGQPDINMVNRWARAATPAIEWLMAQTGAPINATGPAGTMAEPRFRSIPFATTVRGPAGSRYHLAGGTPGMVYQAAERAGVQMLIGVQATSLRTNAAGAVIGAYARDRNISAQVTFNLRPNGAVVLATGGFDNNTRLMRQHNPDSAFDVGGGVTGCGSGIEMAQAIGADTLFKGGIVGWMAMDNRPFPHPAGLHLPAFAAHNLLSQCGAVWRPSGAPNQTFNAGAFLNPAGEAAYGVAVQGQMNRSGFTPNRPVRQLFFDANANEYPITVRWMLNRRWEDARRSGPVPADRNTPAYDVNFSFWRAVRVDSLDTPLNVPGPPGGPGAGGFPAFGTILDLSVATATERGWLVQSATIAGLEQGLRDAGFPWGGYHRTLEAALTEAGLNPATGNYWRLVRSVPSTLASKGGLMINEHAQVLRNGQPIPGLFAAGDVANGQFYFNTYPSSGSALSMAATFGYIAGRFIGGRPHAIQ